MAGMVKIFQQTNAGPERLPEVESTHPDLDFRLHQIEENLAKLDSCPK
jgi:hypothetical protein